MITCFNYIFNINMTQQYINVKIFSGPVITIPLAITKYTLTARNNCFSYPIISCIPKSGYICVNKITGEFKTFDNIKDITGNKDFELIRMINKEGILVYTNNGIVFNSFDDLITHIYKFNEETQKIIVKYSYPSSISLLRNFTRQTNVLVEMINRIKKRQLGIEKDTLSCIYSILPQYELHLLTADEVDDFCKTYCSS